MPYAEALRFLLDLLDATRYPRPPGREANLIRVGRLLARLGPPERDLAPLLGAGTEGELGAVLDATNVCDPLLSVITPISYDHMEVLGRTLGAIAQEKVGIIRAGRPVVIAPQPPEAEEALRLACARVGASLVRVAGRARAGSGGGGAAASDRRRGRGAQRRLDAGAARRPVGGVAGAPPHPGLRDGRHPRPRGAGRGDRAARRRRHGYRTGARPPAAAVHPAGGGGGGPRRGGGPGAGCRRPRGRRLHHRVVLPGGRGAGPAAGVPGRCGGRGGGGPRGT